MRHRLAQVLATRWVSSALMLLLAGVMSACASAQGFVVPGEVLTTPKLQIPRSPRDFQVDGGLPESSRTDAEDGTEDADAEPDQIGLASWYGAKFHKRRTASGELFDMRALTAAHRTLPFGTRVCVRSQLTGRSVVVRINDRGPFTGKRVIDVSRAAAEELGMVGLGLKRVELFELSDDSDDCPAS